MKLKDTKILKIDPNNIEIPELHEAANILSNGGTVVFPTETVYGLGANALDEVAITKIYEAKGRPSDNPLIVHISSIEAIDKIAQNISDKAKMLMDKFWPGPLTLIFKKSDRIPQNVTGGLDTVAIRMPSHPIAKKLIELSQIPVAAPSANLSGKPSPTREEHVLQDLEGRVDVIICGGSSEVGVESTVIDMTTDIPMILRPGGVTKEEIEEVIGKVQIDPGILMDQRNNIKPKSPGMKYTHYSPEAEVIMVNGELNNIIEKIEDIRKEKELSGYKIGIMATEETKSKYHGGTIISVGSRMELKTVASNLFKTLREFDEKKVDLIIAEGFQDSGMGQAIMNRLTKAAGYNIVEA